MSMVIVTTDDALEAIVQRQVLRALELVGVVRGGDGHKVNSGDGVPVQDELNTVLVRKMLTLKGYQVKTKPALLTVLRGHKVEGVRRGREKWYKTCDIERIPARK